MTIGVEHTIIVKRLSKLDAQFEKFGCHVQSQQPIAIRPKNEPEPDAAIIRGTLEDYINSHPGPADVLCVIEVFDSSLSRDRIYKQQLYANANIPMYVIVNLVDRVVEVYRDPIVGSGCYSAVTPVLPPQCILLPTASGEPVEVPAAQMFVPVPAV